MIQVLCRIHTEQLHFKPSASFQFCILYIIFIQQFMNFQKLPYLEKEFHKCIRLLRISCIPLFFKISFHLSQKIHQFYCKWRNTFHQPIILALAFHLKHQFIDRFQTLHKFFISVLHQFFHLENVFFIDGGTVHFPSTFHEVVCFIDQKQIISADIVCKKSFQMCRRIEHIIIITDHPIRPF